MNDREPLKAGWITLALTLLIGGCALPDRTAPELDLSIPAAWGERTIRTEDAHPGWIHSFNDPRLEELLKEALQKNHDLMIASAKLEEASATTLTAGAPLYPELNAGASGGRNEYPWATTPGGVKNAKRSTASLGVSLNLSWELDLWGRLRGQKAAAIADLQGARLDEAAARFSLAAQTAKAWFTLIESNFQSKLAEQMLSNLQKNRDTVVQQHDAGSVSGFDVEMADAALKQGKNNLLQRQNTLAQSRRTLEVLLGRYPSGELQSAPSLPTLPDSIPAGIPSDVLQNRPDLLAAEWKWFASKNRVFSAKAQRFPRISLTSSFGSSSNALANLTNGNYLLATIMSNLTQPILDGGQIEANIRSSKAQQRQLAAEYARLVLTAFQEVENALDLESTLSKEEVLQKESAEHYQKAFHIAEERYRNGQINILSELSAQSSLFQAESNLLAVQRQRLTNRVDLLLALGGSFDDGTFSKEKKDMELLRLDPRD